MKLIQILIIPNIFIFEESTKLMLQYSSISKYEIQDLFRNINAIVWD